MVVTRKYGSYGQRTLRVATYLRTNLLVTPTTGTSNVRLSYVALSIILTRFLRYDQHREPRLAKPMAHARHQTRTAVVTWVL